MHIWLDTGRGDDGYGLIVLDPPWENASAARGAKYATLPSRNLLGIPLQQLTHPVRVSMLLGACQAEPPSASTVVICLTTSNQCDSPDWYPTHLHCQQAHPDQPSRSDIGLPLRRTAPWWRCG